MAVRCLFGACTVDKEQTVSWGRCLFGACTVLKDQKTTWGRCLFGADYSKEEYQNHPTNQSIALVLSNKKAALE